MECAVGLGKPYFFTWERNEEVLFISGHVCGSGFTGRGSSRHHFRRIRDRSRCSSTSSAMKRARCSAANQSPPTTAAATSPDPDRTPETSCPPAVSAPHPAHQPAAQDLSKTAHPHQHHQPHLIISGTQPSAQHPARRVTDPRS